MRDKNSYYEYFFEEIVGIKDKVVTQDLGSYELSIVKDKLERATKRLMERTWRNVVFYFMDEEEASDRKPLKMYTLAKRIFEELKNSSSYLFIRSYVYIVLIDDSTDEINKRNYSLFYFNTNYKFTNVNGKSNIFNNIKYSFIVQDVEFELDAMRNKNMDAIDCVKAYFGQLELYDYTKDKLESIEEMITNEKSRILIEGPARSGKTIIAMQLLHKYPEAKFLLINYHFYVALKDAFAVSNLAFPKERIYHHDINRNRKEGCSVFKSKSTNWEKKFVFDLDFIIVDEAQRLADLPKLKRTYGSGYLPAFKELTILAKEPNIAIYLGDNYQRINPKLDEGFEKLKEILSSNDLNYVHYNFNETVGIPTNIVFSIKYLLEHSNEVKTSLGEYNISVLKNHSKFIESYRNDKTFSKHITTLPYYADEPEIIECGFTHYPKELSNTDFQYFLNEEVMSKYTLSTYEIISRELQVVYFVIPSEIDYDTEEGIFDSIDKLPIEFLLNHLYVNMTRATQKLVIYTSNNELYNYLTMRLNQLKSYEQELIQSSKDIIEQQINFALYSSDKENIHLLEDKLFSKGFKGFTHATKLDNLVKILQNDQLKSRALLYDGFVDIADQNVISITSDFVKSKVRFYLKEDTPTLYHFKKNDNVVFMIFDFSLAENSICYFSDGNAGSQYSTISGVIDEVLEYDWDTIFSIGAFPIELRDEIVRKRNAELLVTNSVCISHYLDKLVFNCEEDMNVVVEMFPDLSSKCVIIKSYF